MILTTTNSVEGKRVREYKGIVHGETIVGANAFKDIMASVRDVLGGRSGAYEEELKHAREIALDEMAQEAKRIGANAVIGIDIDYEVVGKSMLMVTASGTAVLLD
jgi:uncharacterized protein YbjQ (UPF0145 family)